MKTLSVLLLSLMLVGAALAQSNRYGDPNFDRNTGWRSGMPNVLKVVATDVPYTFDGSAVEIPFTLDGGPAEVFLAVYSKDANPQYDGAAFAAGGVEGSILRAAGMDTMISVTAGQTFAEGANVIAWDGKDFNGQQVAAGNYSYYLFALDNVSNPTLVGPGAHTGYWTTFDIDQNQNPPVIWAPQFIDDNWVVQRAAMGTDYLANPGAWESLDVSWVNETFGSTPAYRDISFYIVDPDDPNVGYMGSHEWDVNEEPAGAWKVVYDPENGTLLPDESWSASDGGFIQLERRLVGGAVKASVGHPWVKDDGLVYIANMERVPPMTPQVVVLDRATGEVANLIDLTDIYFHDYDGTGNSIDTSGPFGIDVDERGVYTTGFWSQPDAFPGHFTLDGDVIWVNQNGDGFIDRYFGDEAEARGLNPGLDQMINTHVKAGKYNVAILSGFNLPTWGSVVGPDGHGLFKINIPKMSVGLGTDCLWISNDSAIDGLYIGATDGLDLVQVPFDATMATLGNDIATAVAELASDAVPDGFALDDNYPNPFNASTTIGFSIPDRGQAVPVTLTVYNTTGQMINTLLASEQMPGQYKITWDGTNDLGQTVASGMYLYRLHVGQEFVETKQMTLLK
jgi:flagellar hook assembly protein FlgD